MRRGISGSLGTEFTLRKSGPMTIKMHIKDFPADGLVLVGPSDPSFETKLHKELSRGFHPSFNQWTYRNQIFVAPATVENLHGRGEFALKYRWVGANRQC